MEDLDLINLYYETIIYLLEKYETYECKDYDNERIYRRLLSIKYCVDRLIDKYEKLKRCSHCGAYFKEDGKNNHQSQFCDKCKDNHFGKEVIEEE